MGGGKFWVRRGSGSAWRRRASRLEAALRSSEKKDGRAAALATQQHGLITRSQALALGFKRTAIHRRLKGGRWVALRRCVYCFAGTPRTRHRDILEACLEHGEDAVASHFTAAELWRIAEVGRRETPHVLVSRGASHGGGAVVHRPRQFEPEDRDVVNGIPVTSALRTLVDLAPILPKPKLELAVMDAIRRELIDAEDLRRRVEKLGRAPGADKLRAIVEGEVYSEFVESDVEARALQVVVGAGFPKPETSCVIVRGGEVLGDVDLFFPEHRVVVECDPDRTHGSDSARARDLEKTRALRRNGVEVVRVKPRDLKGDAQAFLLALADRCTAQERKGLGRLEEDGFEVLPSPRREQRDLERRRAGYVS